MKDDSNSNEKPAAKMLGGITGKGFMPKQSGNPSGRPKKRLSEYYEALVAQPLPEDLRIGLKLEPGATYGEAIALVKRAQRSKVRRRLRGRLPIG